MRDFQCTSKNMASILPWLQILRWLWCKGWAVAVTCSWDGSPHKGKLCQLREFPLENCRCREAQEDGRCHSCLNHFNISLPSALGPWRIFLMNKTCNSLSHPRSGTLGPWPGICFVSCLHDAIESSWCFLVSACQKPKLLLQKRRYVGSHVCQVVVLNFWCVSKPPGGCGTNKKEPALSHFTMAGLWITY